MRITIICMLVFVIVALADMQHQLSEIKHMINEVVCEALEMEETWAESEE